MKLKLAADNRGICDQICSQISLVHLAQEPQFADLRKLNARTLDSLAADRKRLAELKIKDDGRPETVLLNERTERQILVAQQIEDNLRDQSTTLDAVEGAAGSLSAAKVELLKNLESTLQLIERQAEHDRGEASLWQNYYNGLKEVVEDRLQSEGRDTPKISKRK